MQVLRDRLRLVWSYGGKRYFLSLGLADTKINRIAADIRARQIEGDIATANFDPTLNKYKAVGLRSTDETVFQLFEKFIVYKAKRIDVRTIQKYRPLSGHLVDFFGQRAIAQVMERDTEQFKDWMLLRVGATTLRDYLSLVKGR